MKKCLAAFCILLILACQNKASEKKDLQQFIPANSTIVVNSPNFHQFVLELEQNSFLQQYELQLKEKIKGKLRHFEFSDTTQRVMISFANIDQEDFTFAFLSENFPEFTLDSLDNQTTEISETNLHKLQRFPLENDTIFITNAQGVFISGNSRTQVENLSKGEDVLTDSEFQKVLSAADESKTAIFIKNNNFVHTLDELFPALALSSMTQNAGWTGLDLNFSPNGIIFNGISIAQKEVSSILNVFENAGTSTNEIAKITPASASGFYSITYRSLDTLLANLRNFRKDSLQVSKSNLFHSATEIGVIFNNDEQILVVNTTDMETAKDALPLTEQTEDQFRGIPIYSLGNGNEFLKVLKPLISSENLQYYIILENFIAFSGSPEPLENIIASFQNNSTLAERQSYRESTEKLSSQSHILLVANSPNFRSILERNIKGELKDEMANFEWQGPGIGAIQFVQENGYAHVHAVLEKSDGPHAAQHAVEQMLSVDLEASLATKPFLVKNHLNNQMDIAVQDENNQLYLISNKGQIYWKKQLSSPILGEIKQVDLYKNGKFQLAFATKRSIEVIDRNGNTVKPFPLNFEDEITQPLSLFDYDNNRNYRFLVVQHDEIYMYDSKGQIVRGFTFRKAKSEVVQPPKHMRIGNRDYILIPENSGNLNILNRRGRTRVAAKENFNFSSNEWYLYENEFLSTTAEGNLVKINTSGSVGTEALNLDENHQINATQKTLVWLSENILNIKGNTVNLDYGLYTYPQIFYVNNKIYVSVTDTQAQRVLIFDSNGNLLPNLPIYGTSAIDLNNVDIDGRIEFAVQGEENEILLYKL